MPEQEQAPTPQKSGKKSLFKAFWQIVMKLIIPALIIAAAIAYYQYQEATQPKARQGKRRELARLVTVETARKTNAQATIQAMGTVKAACETTLKPEVSGIVVDRDPAVVPGGIVAKDKVLYRIDRRNYEAVVKQRESDAARADQDLKLESGNQIVAKQEMAMLDDLKAPADQALILRQPQLAYAKAQLASARAALDKALLDVKRCTITAPFNGIITEKFVDKGTLVSPAAPLVTLMGTDEAWIEVLVQVDMLRWIQHPDGRGAAGSAVRIHQPFAWGESVFRTGRVIQLLPALERQGRMARLLVSLKDPFCLNDPGGDTPRLLMDDYVRVEIQGLPLADVIELKREHLRDGDRVWLMDKERKLAIQPVDILFRTQDKVYIQDGIKAGDRIITTDMPVAVAGMPLRLEEKQPVRP